MDGEDDNFILSRSGIVAVRKTGFYYLYAQVLLISKKFSLLQNELVKRAFSDPLRAGRNLARLHGTGEWFPYF